MVSVGDLEELADGRVLVAGTTSSGQFFVQRYSAALAPDADAMLTGSRWQAHAMDVDGAGRVLVAGGTGSEGVVVRFGTTFGLDPGFGDGGVRTIPVAGSVIRDVESLPDGRVLAAGDSPRAGLVARMSDAGVLDPAFGTSGTGGGVIAHQRDGHVTRFADALVDGTGGIYVGGDAESQSGRDLVLYRFDDRGFPDATLDPSGSRRIAAGGAATGLGVAVDGIERPHVLGAAGSYAAAARMLPNAAPSAAIAGPDAVQTGRTAGFDGSLSTDPENALRRYEWDLDGDGGFETDGGTNPTASRAFPAAGTAIVRLRVTDHRGLQSTAEKSVQVQDPPAVGVPQPLLGRAFVAEPVGGVVLIRPPGASRSRPLRAGEQIPERTLVDARRGRVRIVSARDAKGTTESALFYLGQFRPSQASGTRAYTTLSLAGGSFRGCGTARPRLRVPLADAAASRKRRRVIRRLWGDGKGRFRTKGRYASATVRGTKWQTIDRCDGVKLRVVRGVVGFRDLLRATRTRNVRAGRTAFVPSRRRKR